MWQVQRPKGQTVLAIAHRLSSLQGADQLIFVGKDGKIAETGTWKELLRIPNGKFAEYVKVQKLGKGGNEGNGEGEGGEEEGGGGKKKKKKTGKSTLISKGMKKQTKNNNTQTHETDNHNDHPSTDDDDNDAASLSSLSSLLSSPSSVSSEASTSSVDDAVEIQEIQELADPIRLAMQAMTTLKHLAIQEDLPYDLITPLEVACDNVLDYHRVSELAAMEAQYWLPYNNNNNNNNKEGKHMPLPLITSLRTMSRTMSAQSLRSRSGGLGADGVVGGGVPSSLKKSSPSSAFQHSLKAIPLKRVRSDAGGRQLQNRMKLFTKSTGGSSGSRDGRRGGGMGGVGKHRGKSVVQVQVEQAAK
jgi:hypothetical protein